MSKTTSFFGYLRRNKQLAVGLLLLLFLFLFASVGRLFIETKEAYPLGAPIAKSPSLEYPLGTDTQGRNLIAVAIVGTYLTAKVGLIAGAIGLLIGTVVGFVSGYYGGMLDRGAKLVVDTLLAIPGLLILVVVASALKTGLTLEGMALIVAALAWMWPARSIRSQVLTLRERPFVRVAKLSGMSDLEIIFKELLPNLLPFLGAALVVAVTAAVLASLGLEVLGLGPMREPTMGVTLYWLLYYGALIRGMWWWLATPVSIMVLLFVGLFLVSSGLDELANPRLRRKV